jgi:DNA invertase Pin-like site-specific DNA recombinase
VPELGLLGTVRGALRNERPYRERWLSGTYGHEQIAGLEAQERDLLAQGCERLWREQTSALGPRNGLEEAIAFARSGDSLVVTKICRLARSVADLVAIIDRLEKEGREPSRILSMGIDTATPTGRRMLNLLASISQFEREVMLERQREGVAKAKAEGKYKGRIQPLAPRATRFLNLTAKDSPAKGSRPNSGSASPVFIEF